jgi:NarL family two-component system response regulator LiaR
MLVRQMSILLVDDHPGFLRILTNFLERSSRGEIVIVGTALGGREGLTKAQALHPHVIVIDLAMPDLHGLVAIPQLRNMLPDTGIIALSLLDAGSYRDEALALGANEFVSKARLGTDLLPAIQRLGGGDRSWQEPGNGPGRSGAPLV